MFFNLIYSHRLVYTLAFSLKLFHKFLNWQNVCLILLTKKRHCQNPYTVTNTTEYSTEYFCHRILHPFIPFCQADRKQKSWTAICLIGSDFVGKSKYSLFVLVAGTGYLEPLMLHLHVDNQSKVARAAWPPWCECVVRSQSDKQRFCGAASRAFAAQGC